MNTFFVPALLVVVLPAIYLAHRIGLTGHPGIRRVGGVALLALLAAAVPWQGVEIVYVRRFHLLVAAGAAALLLLCGDGVIRTRAPRRPTAAVLALAVLAGLAAVNFFAFHGGRTFLHLHDVAHYHLGAKYYGELGYGGLYTAMLRAESETHGDRFRTPVARDLATQRPVHVGELLRASDPVKAAFTTRRWEEFRRDADYFRERLGARYGDVLLDHGFNATPVWALIGGALAGRVPPGSAAGLRALAMLDVLLLAGLFTALGRVFGGWTAAVAALYFAVLFGAGFAWTGGSFLRHLWLAAAGFGVCCLARRRHAAAGALFALAAALRLFPILFLVPLAVKAGAALWRTRRLPRRYRDLFVSFAVSMVVLVGATAALPRGLAHWREFAARLEVHRHHLPLAPNVVGLTETLLADDRRAPPAEGRREAVLVRAEWMRIGQLLLVVFPVALAIAAVGRRWRDAEAPAAALPLVFAGASLASYDYAFLVLLVPALRASPRSLALLFAVESASYALTLFEERQALLFSFRGALVAFLAVALWLERRGVAGRDGSG